MQTKGTALLLALSVLINSSNVHLLNVHHEQKIATTTEVETASTHFGGANISNNETYGEVDDSLYLLSHLINSEAGSSWCSNEMKRMVGIVALNRVKSDLFPDTLYEVINQKGQYEVIELGTFYREPSEECIDIAYDLLTNGYDEPETVLYQAEFKQGSGVYKKVQNMYFCYQ